MENSSTLFYHFLAKTRLRGRLEASKESTNFQFLMAVVDPEFSVGGSPTS